MAHGNYDCCAVCDTKMNYSNDASTKSKLCASCAVDTGHKSTDTLWKEINDATEGKIDGKAALAKLRSAGFSMCFYPNDIDEAYKHLVSKVEPELPDRPGSIEDYP